MAILLISSIRERQARARLISSLLLLLLVAAWLGVGLWSPGGAGRILLLGLFWVTTALFFLPHGGRRSIRVVPSDEQVDERDVIFSREEYRPGTPAYDAYYARCPEKRSVDDRIRQLPEMLSPGGQHYEPALAKQIRRDFVRIERLGLRVDGPVAAVRQTPCVSDRTAWIKQRAIALGADAVGIAPLDQRYVYSHVGRGPEPWGDPIENDHPFAILFTLEMQSQAVDSAPRLPITAETSRNYLRGAEISIELAREIRATGYEARAHIAGSNYQIMLPPLAHAAGLGELGRMGYLIAPRLGPRLRLGAVTTTLPLELDQPIDFGVLDFCEACKKCVANCPSTSIRGGAKTWERGVLKWQLRLESCLHYWRVVGSDCGLCMRVCPYSHPPTPIHNLVRFAIARSAFARRIAIWGDDLLYGRRMPIGRS